MGVRPPQQDDDDEPDTVAFGIAALDDRLERAELYFPATSEEVLEALGDQTIPYDASGNEVRLSDVLEETHKTRFENRQQLMNALHPVFEARREQKNNSVVGRLRSLLPF
ncbi:MAG: hypothetical protein PPP58_10120 [Natronomonas sp.]